MAKEISEICKVEGCDKKVYSKELCNRHYNQVRRHGHLTPEVERITYKANERECSEPGCTKEVVAKGLCTTCYKRKQRAEAKAKQIETEYEPIEGALNVSPTPSIRRRVVRRRTAAA